MNALFANETEFWLWIRELDAVISSLEWSYHANDEKMTEVYSSNCFPVILGKD